MKTKFFILTISFLFYSCAFAQKALTLDTIFTIVHTAKIPKWSNNPKTFKYCSYEGVFDTISYTVPKGMVAKVSCEQQHGHINRTETSGGGSSGSYRYFICYNDTFPRRRYPRLSREPNTRPVDDGWLGSDEKITFFFNAPEASGGNNGDEYDYLYARIQLFKLE